MKKNNGPFIINIGAGLSNGKSWLNYDVSPTLRISKIPFFGRLLLKMIHGPNWSQNTYYGDILKGLPLQPESCKLAFSSHTFEHLSLADFDCAVKNVHTYLQPGGVFRIIVPDIEVYAKSYVKRLENNQGVSDASVDFIRATHLGFEKSRASLRSRLREAFANSRHQWLWDKHSLAKRIESHGFKKIKVCNYGEWADPRFSEIEAAGRHQNAICLECEK